MPRKKKIDEFAKWLQDCNAGTVLVKYNTYSFTVSIVSFGSKSSSEYLHRAKELYPDAIGFECLNLSGRVQL